MAAVDRNGRCSAGCLQESLHPSQLEASLQLLEAVVRACWPRMGHHMLPILRRTWEAHKASAVVPELQAAAAIAEGILRLLAAATPDAFRAVLDMLQGSLDLSDSERQLLSSLSRASVAPAKAAISATDSGGT